MGIWQLEALQPLVPSREGDLKERFQCLGKHYLSSEGQNGSPNPLSSRLILWEQEGIEKCCRVNHGVPAMPLKYLTTCTAVDHRETSHQMKQHQDKLSFELKLIQCTLCSWCPYLRMPWRPSAFLLGYSEGFI